MATSFFQLFGTKTFELYYTALFLTQQISVTSSSKYMSWEFDSLLPPSLPWNIIISCLYDSSSQPISYLCFCCYFTTAIFNRCAARIFKICNTYLVKGTDLFSLRLSNKKNNSQHNNSRPVWINQQNLYFLVCHRILVISLCVPWDEKGWKSLLYYIV